MPQSLPPAPANGPLFDSHAHLDAPEFDGDRERVLASARAAGVGAMVVPATHAEGWPKLAALCAQDDGLHPAYGLHPCWLARHADADLERLDAWLDTHRAVAVGECGLDFLEPADQRDRQLRMLRGQFEIAFRRDLPLVLHARHAFEAMILELRRFRRPLRGVVHSFSGSAEQARALAALGFCVGIGGPVTYPRARRLRAVVAALPIGSLLLETDSPDQPGAAHRGQRNEPAYLVEVLDCIAALRGKDPAELARETRDNAKRLFLRAA